MRQPSSLPPSRTDTRFRARVNHPHIPPLFDSAEAGERVFFTMPYIARRDSSRGLALLRQLSDTTDQFTWADQLGHAELLAAAGDAAGARRLLRRRNDLVSGFGTTINYRPLALRFHLLFARAAETAGDRATAIAEDGFVSRRLSHADPEFQSVVNEAASGLRRLGAKR